jgi:hypothetical protein
MDALEEQIILTTEVDETAINSGKSHNPGVMQGNAAID